MENVRPKVVIVLLNYNGLKDSIECLESLRKTSYGNSTILVVENGSKGNDGDIIKKKFGTSISMIEEKKNLGFVGGCNKGIRWALQSGAKYILLINNDTVVAPDFLEHMVDIAQCDERIGVIGPKVYIYEHPKIIATAGGKVNFWTGNTPLIGRNMVDDGQFDQTIEVDFIMGCCLLIKVEAIKKIGFLDEEYFSYYEETDLCIRVKNAGYKVIYTPQAKIWHKSSKSNNVLPIYYMTRNRCLFVKKHSTNLQLIFFHFFLLVDIVYHLEKGLFIKPKFFIAYLKGVFDGLALSA